MYSDLKNIDMNISKDITKGEDTKERCIWFTIPVCVREEGEGEGKHSVYDYFSFPSTARYDVESDYVYFSTEGPYIFNMAMLKLFDF